MLPCKIALKQRPLVLQYLMHSKGLLNNEEELDRVEA